MNKLYKVNISNNETNNCDDLFEMSYFFKDFNVAKKFADEKYNEIYENFGQAF